SVQFIDSTTLVATTPPGPTGPTWVAVWSSDYRSGWIPNGFTYRDVTPPLVFSWLSGTQGLDDWYVGDVTVNWAWWDPDSPVTSTSGCATTVVTTDTAGTLFTCSATSDGGTASASTIVKRDATPPTVVITSPSASQPIYDRDQSVPAAYQCSDGVSGVAYCTG